MKNRKPYSLFYKIFFRIPVSIANVIIHLKPWVLDARKKSYYVGESPLKSKFRILLDHLYTASVFGQTYKDDYYAMGLDQKGKKIKDYIGEAMNTLALYTFSTSRGLPLSQWKYDMCATLKDKWIFSQMCKSYNLSTPETYGLTINGKLISDIWKSLSDIQGGDYDVIFKPLDGACGLGIFHLRSFGGKMIVKGKEISMTDLTNMLAEGKFLIQKFISNQHEGMKNLYPDACNTLRITVARYGDECKVMGVMCMLGAHGTDCSNWHFGGVSINVKDDGILDKYGYCKIDKRITAHPDSGAIFEGYRIPYFEEAIELAKNATRCFYGFKSIGWDVAITTEGPTLIEGNDDWGIVAHQMVENRGWMQNWEKYHGEMNI